MSSLEIIGSILGVLGVWLTIRRNLWCWPVGLVQVSLYGWIFFQARLYSDALLQGVFFVLLVYGWWYWLHGGVQKTEPPVRRLPALTILGLIVLGTVVTAGHGWVMATYTDADLPWWDAFILVFSLLAQWLQARKRLECWLGWMLVNVVAIGVYWVKDLRVTAGLYLLFFFLAVAGYRAWRAATMRQSEEGARVGEGRERTANPAR